MQKFILTATILLLLASCKDDDSIIGLHLQDGRFTVSYDTIHTIHTTTKKADSLSLTGATVGLLGDYNDPQFGRTRAALVFQLVPKANVANFGVNATADSIVLKLTERSGYYGLDSAAQHIVRVYRVKDGMDLADLDSTPTNFSILENYKGLLLAEQPIILSPKDSIPIEIKFNTPDIASAILSDTAHFASDTTFKRYFPGLIVETENTSANGNIISIDFAQADTRMRLHFKNNTDTTHFDFLLKTDATKRYSIFDHQYAATQVSTALTDTTFQTLAYIQGMNGVGVKIEIGGLDQLFSDEKWAINSAQLILQLAPESDTAKYLPPSQIMVKVVDGANEIFTPDYQTQGGASTLPENYDITLNGYKIKISNLLYKSIVERKQTITLTAYAISPLTKANRAIIAGSGHQDIKLRPVVHIIRSK